MPELTEEQKARRRENLRLARERKKAAREARGSEKNEPVDRPSEPPVEEPLAEPAPLELTQEEREKILAEARKTVQAELAKAGEAKRLELIQKTLAAETLKMRQDLGLTDHRDDLIEHLVDVAPFTDKLVIDGKIYMHGHWYTVPRKLHDVMREMEARSWDSEERAGNPNRKFRREVAGTMNPLLHERRLDDGSLTVGLDTRVHGRTGSAINRPTSV